MIVYSTDMLFIIIMNNIRWHDLEKEFNKEWFRRITALHRLALGTRITDDCVYNWGLLSRNANLDMDVIYANKDCPWDWYELSLNPTFTWGDVKQNLKAPWDWKALTHNINIDSIIIKNNPNIDWDHRGFCRDRTITWANINANRSKFIYGFNAISKHENITCLDISKNLDFQWSWDYIALNPNLTLDFIVAHSDKPFAWSWLSRHAIITWDFVKTHLHYPWDWNILSLNQNMTMDIINDNSDRPWNLKYMLGNPNITWEEIDRIIKVESFPTGAPLYYLLTNPMTKWKKNWMLNKINTITASTRIHRIWRTCSWDPSYILGKKLCEQRFENSINPI